LIIYMSIYYAPITIYEIMLLSKNKILLFEFGNNEKMLSKSMLLNGFCNIESNIQKNVTYLVASS